MVEFASRVRERPNTVITKNRESIFLTVVIMKLNINKGSLMSHVPGK